jgi:hypothetical protein
MHSADLQSSAILAHLHGHQLIAPIQIENFTAVSPPSGTQAWESLRMGGSNCGAIRVAIPGVSSLVALVLLNAFLCSFSFFLSPSGLPAGRLNLLALFRRKHREPLRNLLLSAFAAERNRRRILFRHSVTITAFCCLLQRGLASAGLLG